MNIEINTKNKNNPKLNLTRYLYAKDEVELSLMFSLIDKKNHTIEESIFWVSELFYSGYIYDLTQLIWKIYYDFYAQYNPKLELYIERVNKNILKNFDITSIISLIKTLRVSKCSDNVFSLRISKEPESFTIFKNSKGRIPNWLKKYDKNERLVARLINNLTNNTNNKNNINNNGNNNGNKWQQLIYIIRNNLDYNENINNSYNFVKIIIDVLLSNNSIETKNESIEKINQNIEKMWFSISYNDYFHRIIALIVSFITDDNLINYNMFIIKPKQDEIEFIQKLNNDTNDIINKRLFPINKKIGCFTLLRYYYDNDIEQLKTEYKLYWEYHASNVPLWIMRFNEHNAYINNNTKELLFMNDEMDNMFDKFYSKYQYDLDEKILSGLLDYSCLEVEKNKDIIDIMDEIFDNDNNDDNDDNDEVCDLNDLRIDFEDLLISNERKIYNNTDNSSDSFDFTSFKNILNTI